MAPAVQTLEIKGIGVDDSPRLQAIHRHLIPDEARFRQELAWMREHGAVYIDPVTIPGLVDLGERMPALLFGLCGRRTFPRPVAIVGTRRPDWYGKLMGRFLGKAVALAGASVVSGGALGIDTLAHKGCLEAGGATITVFAGGLAQPHPPSNRALFERVSSQGCIISELPPLVPAKRYSFTERNRIIAALGLATIVVQAGPVSGALVTAHQAMRMGRQVFAVPADTVFENGRGTGMLIDEGAIALTGPKTLLTGLGLRVSGWPRAARRPIHGEPVLKKVEADVVGSVVAGNEAEVYEMVRSGTGDVDTLCIKTGLETAQVMSILSTLEIKGFVQRTGGNRYVPVRDLDLFA